MHFFVDTNVLIDVITGRNGSEASKQLFALAYLGKLQLSVSTLSYVNAVYICKRQNMRTEDVLNALKKISGFIRVESLTSTNVLKNLSTDWKDYEDATQASCAEESSASYIVTHNGKDFKNSTLCVITPQEAVDIVLAQLRNKYNKV